MKGHRKNNSHKHDKNEQVVIGESVETVEVPVVIEDKIITDGTTIIEEETIVDVPVQVEALVVGEIEKPDVIQVAHNAAIHEVIKPTEIKEVQHVIRRDIDVVEVHQITQPIYERETLPVEVREVVDSAVAREDVIMGSQEVRPLHETSSLVIEDVQREVVVKPAIVEEHLHRKIVEEIQPIIYREVTQPVLIKEVVPISEHIIEKPIVTQEMRAPIVRQVGSTAGEPMLYKERIPIAEKPAVAVVETRAQPATAATATTTARATVQTPSTPVRKETAYVQTSAKSYAIGIAAFSVPAILALVF